MTKTVMNSNQVREQIYEILDYTFKNESLLVESLTHRSLINEVKDARHNERMEFLGDSVLSVVISEYIYKIDKDYLEGKLSILRSSIVCEEALAEASTKLGIGKYILMAQGEIRNGGREKVAILADVFESLIAAIYLDGGIDEAKRFIMTNLSDRIDKAIKGEVFSDYKTRAQEIVQGKFKIGVEYKSLKEEGPDHEKVFTAGVYFKDSLLGIGKGSKRKDAEQSAAKEACVFLSRNLNQLTIDHDTDTLFFHGRPVNYDSDIRLNYTKGEA